MALSDSLVELWTLDEESGTRAGLNGYDLTDNNTVGSTAGKIGNAASFVSANAEYLSRDDESIFAINDGSFTFAGWVYFETLDNNATVLSRANSTAFGGYVYWIRILSSRLRWTVQDGVTGVDALSAVLSAGVWYFFCAWYDAALAEVSLKLNANATSTVAMDLTGYDVAAPFEIGRLVSGTGSLNGRVDQLAYWNRVLTSDERAELYNGGQGLTADPWGLGGGGGGVGSFPLSRLVN